MALEHVKPGPIRIPATDWNAIADATHEARKRRYRAGMRHVPLKDDHDLVDVANGTDRHLPRYAVVGLDPGPVETDQIDEWQNQRVFRGIEPGPAHHGRWAVLLEPAAPGDIVPAVASGVVHCLVHVCRAEDVIDAVGIEEGNTEYLIADRCGGGWVLWREPGAGVRWAIVRISNPPCDEHSSSSCSPSSSSSSSSGSSSASSGSGSSLSSSASSASSGSGSSAASSSPASSASSGSSAASSSPASSASSRSGSSGSSSQSSTSSVVSSEGPCDCGTAAWRYDGFVGGGYGYGGPLWTLISDDCTGDCVPQKPSGPQNADDIPLGSIVITCCAPPSSSSAASSGGSSATSSGGSSAASSGGSSAASSSSAVSSSASSSPASSASSSSASSSASSSGSGGGCGGNCTWQWSDAQYNWVYVSGDCDNELNATTNCYCHTPAEPGTYDGEITTTPCILH